MQGGRSGTRALAEPIALCPVESDRKLCSADVYLIIPDFIAGPPASDQIEESETMNIVAHTPGRRGAASRPDDGYEVRQ